MPDRQVCIDCGTQSPETETNYTLISSQFGWRLTRTRTADGLFNVEWRCPACWKEHKRQKQALEEGRIEARIGGTIPPPSTTSSPPLAGRPLPSFASRPPPRGGEEEPPTLQRPALQRPTTPLMPMRPPRVPASGPPTEGSPIPGRIPPARSPRR